MKAIANNKKVRNKDLRIRISKNFLGLSLFASLDTNFSTTKTCKISENCSKSMASPLDRRQRCYNYQQREKHCITEGLK